METISAESAFYVLFNDIQYAKIKLDVSLILYDRGNSLRNKI